MTQNLIPSTIFCPKCGTKVGLGEMRDPQGVLKLIEAGYSQGAKGNCVCGVKLIFLTKPLPQEPTFTILFDLYAIEGRK